MSGVKIRKPNKIIIGELYIVNYIGWKKVKAVKIVGTKVLVQEVVGVGEPFMVDVDKVKINLL